MITVSVAIMFAIFFNDYRAHKHHDASAVLAFFLYFVWVFLAAMGIWKGSAI